MNYIKFLLSIIQLLDEKLDENSWLVEKLYKIFRLPKLIITFEYKLATTENENEFCHQRSIRPTDNLGWFFRISISNSGRTPIINCDVRLEKIEKKIFGVFEKAGNFSPIFLHWANDVSDNSRDIHYNTPNYLDIVHTVNTTNSFFVFAKKKNIGVGSNTIWPAGEYLFYIKVLGGNIIPKEKKICIDFNGEWDQLKMDLLSK